MSWILAVTGKFNNEDERNFRSVVSNPIHEISSDGLFIASGGIPDTCFFSATPGNESGFVVSGVGLSKSDNHFTVMGTAGWQDVINRDEINFDTIDGHFTGIKWANGSVTAFTDSLGGREMFVCRGKDYTIISTRLDWIARLNPDTRVLFEEIGPAMMLDNQFSNNSILSNTIKLTFDARAKVTPDSFEVIQKPWLPGAVDGSREENIEAMFSSLVFPSDARNRAISFCLSGGMDSRLILALLLKNRGGADWEAITFGSTGHPDSMIAQKMARDLDFKLRLMDQDLPEAGRCLDMIRENASYTFISSPSSDMLQKRYYADLYTGRNIIIDGGFGEIARRGFFNRLQFMGRLSRLEQNLMKMKSNIDYGRFGFLSQDVIEAVKKGVDIQFENLFDDMPPISGFGAGNWLDLLAVRYRYVNYYAHEQSRCDSLALGYSPFSMKFFLNHVFSIPHDKRINAAIFRRIIKRNAPRLARYPFASGSTTVPYSLPALTSKLLAKARKKAGLYFKDNSRHRLLWHLKEFVLDSINSTGVRNSYFYNIQNLSQLAGSYYKGEEHLSEKLDWWVQTELFRSVFRQ